MNFIYQYLPETLISAIGWTIFHSLWQGFLIAAATTVLLLSSGRNAARFRYALSVTSLFLIFFSAVYTFSSVYSDNPAPASGTKTNITLTENAAKLGFENPVKVIEYASDDSAVFASIERSVERYLPFISALWLLGFFVFSLRFVGGLIYTQRIKNYRISPAGDDIERMFRNLADKLYLDKTVNIFESALVKVPSVIGSLKPVILLPVGMLAGLPKDQVEAVIAHELAHIKRYDFVINLFQSFVETILFYHPAVWWLSSVSRTERENSCDDIAVELCGNKIVYAKALANINELAVNESNFVLAASGNKNQLIRRINRMTQNNQNKRAYGGKVLAILVVAAVLIAGSSLSTKSFSSKDANLAGFTLPSFGAEIPQPSESDNFYFDNLDQSADSTRINKGKRTIKFHETVDGDEKSFKAKIKDGEITSLYVDGDKIAEKDFPKYQGLVDKKLKQHAEEMSEYRSTMKEYREKMRDYRDKMSDIRVYDEDSHHDFHVVIPPVPPVPPVPDMIDMDEFRESMRELREDLREDLADIRVRVPRVHVTIPDFDKEAFREGMKEFAESMKNLKFNNEEFEEGMKHFAESMKDFRFDSDKFSAGMEKFHEKMGEFKEKMKVFKNFMHDLKDEMISDGVINDEDDLDRLKFGKDEIKVNGKAVPENLRIKYLELYKKHFGKELTSDNFINFDDDMFWDAD